MPLADQLDAGSFPLTVCVAHQPPAFSSWANGDGRPHQPATRPCLSGQDATEIWTHQGPEWVLQSPSYLQARAASLSSLPPAAGVLWFLPPFKRPILSVPTAPVRLTALPGLVLSRVSW